MKITDFFVMILLAAMVLTGCGASEVPPTETITEPIPTETTPPPSEAPDPVASLMEQMSLRQKVGQLFMVRPEALDETGVAEMTEELAAALEKYPVGGIVMFARNITSPEQITAFNKALQTASEIPLFLSIDEEGGAIARLANHDAFDLPQYGSTASIEDTAQALEMGRTIGAYLDEYGFNMDFAPVADVNTNPDNPIIGTRAFSSDAETAAQLASAAANGLRSQGIIPVFKHFPGHGDTAEDSHSGIAISYKTAEEMRSCEWIPFREATAADFVMVGHIAVPEITGSLIPATMSAQVVTGILKNQLMFEGLVITDALEMGAVTESYTPAEAAVAALKAGCHILLMPENLQEAFDAVVSAVETGNLSEAWLNQTVEKILRFKQTAGLLAD